jgi:hypothetical protein
VGGQYVSQGWEKNDPKEKKVKVQQPKNVYCDTMLVNSRSRAT